VKRAGKWEYLSSEKKPEKEAALLSVLQATLIKEDTLLNG